jgi:hypothetical protein
MTNQFLYRTSETTPSRPFGANHGTNTEGQCSLLMKERDQEAVEHRERRIDEALKETFPASDTPSYVGGAPRLTDDAVDKPDLDRINIDDPDELREWCAYWGCTPAELKEAVQDVGVMAANVEAQLAAKGHKRMRSA